LETFFKSTCSSSHPVLPCTVSANACSPIATTSQGLPLAKAVCRGARAAVALWPWDVASSHLAVSLRSVSPTAIGRTHPSFFFGGMRRAAQRNGAARGWRRPALAVVIRVMSWGWADCGRTVPWAVLRWKSGNLRF